MSGFAMSDKLTRTLYRLFLRQANRMKRDGIEIQFSMPMDKDAWLLNGGGHGWIKPHPEYSVEAVGALLPWLQQHQRPFEGRFSASDIMHIVKEEFRTPQPDDAVDKAFGSLKVLEEQLYLERCSSSAVTRDIRIDVNACYVGTQKELDDTFEEDIDGPLKHYYTYRIRISNIGSSTVQLRSRHWKVLDSNGKLITEVAKGARGVVGCTPILKPNTCFSYYSGTDMDLDGGRMYGSFEMLVLDSKGTPIDSFDAEIATFNFINPSHEEK